MPVGVTPYKPTDYISQMAVGASGAAVADIISYTVPANRVARISYYSLTNFTLGPGVSLQIVRGGTTLTITSQTATVRVQTEFWVLAGDVVKFRVTTAVGASSFDAFFSGEEYEAR